MKKALLILVLFISFFADAQGILQNLERLRQEQISKPIVRINAGGTAVTATDGFANWEDNTTGTGISYTSSSGAIVNTSSVTWTKDSSVLDIPDADIQVLYDVARYTNTIVTYNVPVSNGLYFVRVFLGAQIASPEPVSPLSITIEGDVVVSGFQPSVAWGYRTMGSLKFPVTVIDGSITILISKDSSGGNRVDIFAIEIEQ